MNPAPAARRGRFISLEGGEGSGKSRQARWLVERLAGIGVHAVMTREPGGTPEAEAIRALLVTGDPGRWCPQTEVLLFAAARSEHLTRLIRPALAAGQWVITDRFADSTRAYQGAAQGVDPAFIDAVSSLVVGRDWPDLTLILDVDVDTGLARARQRGGAEDRYERFNRDFHERLRQAYLDIAALEPLRCTLIDACPGEAEVAEAVWAAVKTRFGL